MTTQGQLEGQLASKAARIRELEQELDQERTDRNMTIVALKQAAPKMSNKKIAEIGGMKDAYVSRVVAHGGTPPAGGKRIKAAA